MILNQHTALFIETTPKFRELNWVEDKGKFRIHIYKYDFLPNRVIPNIDQEPACFSASRHCTIYVIQVGRG